ncbi:Scr1 family TA system antitoxin-like transcriptional regulator [Lentzea kentuckyensis]|uniref:Scr1 family TA system antitoxin-like transcriptional regulator n=1 Tax=Lentzea kentuckyensis TaxID=360086 RepID=UPI000A39CF0D
MPKRFSTARGVSSGAHAGVAGSFELMRFDRVEPVVFLESNNSNLVVEHKDAVSDQACLLTHSAMLAQGSPSRARPRQSRFCWWVSASTTNS